MSLLAACLTTKSAAKPVYNGSYPLNYPLTRKPDLETGSVTPLQRQFRAHLRRTDGNTVQDVRLPAGCQAFS